MKDKPTKRDEDLALLGRLFETFKTAPTEAQQKVLDALADVIKDETHKGSKILFTEIKKHCETLQREANENEK